MPVSQRQQEEEKIESQKQADQPVVCIACGDTGVNSKGGVCIPCQKRKEVIK